MATELPPLPKGGVSQRRSACSNIDNRPSWMTSKEDDKRVNSQNNNHIPQDNQRKKDRMWIFQQTFLLVIYQA